MGDHLRLKMVFRRASILFAISLTAAVLCAVPVWWHHAQVAQHCPAPAPSGAPVSCDVRAWYFGPSWAELVAWLLLHFGLCMLFAWAWSAWRGRTR
jgi:hypothetical protein